MTQPQQMYFLKFRKLFSIKQLQLICTCQRNDHSEMARANQTLDGDQIKYETVGVRNNILGDDDFLLSNFLFAAGFQDLLQAK